MQMEMYWRICLLKMKTRLLIIIATIGIIVSGSTIYIYDQMYDCLNHPIWMKHPRNYGIDDCLQMYYYQTLPDYTQARENYAKEQAHREKMIELFSDTPEVVAFYTKHDDANVSVRDDHVSYFAGKESGFQSRMNLYYTIDNELTHMIFYCFNEKSVQYEVAQEDITHYLENKDCTSNNSTENQSKIVSKWDFRKEPSYVIIPLGSILEGNPYLIPEVITVVLGINNTVTWINQDDTAHGIASDKGGDDSWGSTGVLHPGDSFSVTFYSPGIYEYHGQPHPWETGKVIVLEK